MANKSGIYVANINEVKGDFRAYNADTKKAFRKSLATVSLSVERRQKGLLRYRVFNNPKGHSWTGTLWGAIRRQELKWYHWNIGPLSVSYSDWVEGGTPLTGKKPYGNKHAGDFPGHHYIRDSMKGKTVERQLNARLKQDIKNNQKK